MKITRVEYWPVPVQFETPYAIACGEFSTTTLVFLRLVTDTGIVGHGSAGCDVDVTGETDQTVLKVLSEIAEPILRGADPLLVVQLLHELGKQFGSQPSALAAIDMALLDIVGQHARLPLWKLLGGHKDRIPTSMTIGILPEREAIESAQHWCAQGFTILKIKGGRDVESDIARIIHLRERLGPNIELRFDANQGFSVVQVLQFAKAVRHCGVTFIEQPTPASDPALLGQVRAANVIPVMADECVHGPDEAFQIAQQSLADMLNVKLMKCGGILAAQEIAAIAAAAKLPIMVGCMDESALGIAAGLHFALGNPAVEYADLDGHIGLIGDPAANSLRLENGVLYPPDKPGLGVDLRNH